MLFGERTAYNVASDDEYQVMNQQMFRLQEKDYVCFGQKQYRPTLSPLNKKSILVKKTPF
jgi:hypothetical protein